MLETLSSGILCVDPHPVSGCRFSLALIPVFRKRLGMACKDAAAVPIGTRGDEGKSCPGENPGGGAMKAAHLCFLSGSHRPALATYSCPPVRGVVSLCHGCSGLPRTAQTPLGSNPPISCGHSRYFELCVVLISHRSNPAGPDGLDYASPDGWAEASMCSVLR